MDPQKSLPPKAARDKRIILIVMGIFVILPIAMAAARWLGWL